MAQFSMMDRGRFIAQYGGESALHKLIDEKNADALLYAMDASHPNTTPRNQNLNADHYKRIANEMTDEKKYSYLRDMAKHRLYKMGGK